MIHELPLDEDRLAVPDPVTDADAAHVLSVTFAILAAVLGRDEETVGRLARDEQVHWWNVTLTLASLFDDYVHGDAAALRQVASLLEAGAGVVAV
jgi:hypothetical protein